MAECELINECIFFNDRMAYMPAMANVFKTRYCQGDCTDCARYRVFDALGHDSVPENLYPNDAEGAARLLRL